MFIRTESKTSEFERKSKLGNLVKYHRTKKVHIFKCDHCNIEFFRGTGYPKERLSNDNNYYHFCSKCKGQATLIGNENRRKRLAKKLGETWIDSNGYVVVRLSLHSKYSNRQIGKNFSYIREHVKVMQDYLGRQLGKGEVVHHIDGNKINNNISNLDICTVKEHNKCHATSEMVVFELYKQGIVKYNSKIKRYYLP